MYLLEKPDAHGLQISKTVIKRDPRGRISYILALYGSAKSLNTYPIKIIA